MTSIGYSAFSGCSGLTSVEILNSVTSIGEGAFINCSGLTRVIVKDIAAWCKIQFGDYASNPLCYAHHLYSDENSEITNLVIPNSVTSIGRYAFYGCSGLTSLTIVNSVTRIGMWAFRDCYRLNTITSMNSIPPTCDQDVFITSSDDVYTHASLHVPMGSEELYASAYEWRYFNKIEVINNVKSTTLNQVKVTGYNDEIQVSQIEENTNVSVYTLDGKLVHSIPSVIGSTSISVSPDQVYIVKVGAHTFKIAL